MFLSTDTISLTPSQIVRATELAQDAPTEAEQWQHYLNALAQFGVEQWLQKRAPEVSVRRVSDTGCQMTAGPFRLHLLVTDDLGTTEIPVPATAIAATTVPHLYLWVDVIEELGQVQIQQAIQQSQLIQRLRSTPLEAGQYWLNPNWFDVTADRLLLWLRCLDAAALPTVSVPTRPSPITENAINVGLWLSNRLDRLAEELSWVLLPPLTLSLEFRSLRSPTEDLTRVLAELTQQNRIIAPSQLHGGYRDFQWENVALRLYAVTWQPNTDHIWTLLLILGAQPGASLPLGIRLQVRDDSQILTEPVLRDRTQEYLYTQVVGNLTEQFWVSIALDDGTGLTLPAFSFGDRS